MKKIEEKPHIVPVIFKIQTFELEVHSEQIIKYLDMHVSPNCSHDLINIQMY